MFGRKILMHIIIQREKETEYDLKLWQFSTNVGLSSSPDYPLPKSFLLPFLVLKSDISG